MNARKSIIKKTILMGVSTMSSKVLGFVRETLMARYLGVGMLADAFNTAFRIPSAMRKIFAEGALNAALNPSLISVVRKNNIHHASQLVTMIFFTVQCILIAVCIIVSYHAHSIIHLMAPGFSATAVNEASYFAAILIFFIVFISGSAIFASALTATQRFFVPANAQILLNIVLVSELWCCIYYQLSVTTLCWLMVANGILILAVHYYAYKRAGFSFCWPDRETKKEFSRVMKKFGPCIVTAGSIEIPLFIDGIMASYLPVGSISLLSYTSAFMRLPIGLFAIGFATISLPFITHLAIYAPRRMWFYLLESMKLAAWITIPVTGLMMAFSDKIFSTMIVSKTFTEANAIQAGQLLAIFASALFFFSINKILANFYYAFHDTMRPTLISLSGTMINTLLNVVLMGPFGIAGIVLATSISAMVQSILFLFFLHHSHNTVFPIRNFMQSLLKIGIQSLTFGVILYCAYTGIYTILLLLPAKAETFFCKKAGFWLWVGPLCATIGLLMYLTRRRFGIRIYFLDQQR